MTGLVSLPCLCATVRRAARTLTALYDQALQSHGMTGTQFTILQALDLAGPVSQGQLSEILAIDSTTLSRSLRLLLKQGWVRRAQAEDRRAWSLSLSKPGRLVFASALPAWEAAQKSVRAKLGPEAWHAIFQSADQLTTAVQTIGANK